MHLKVLPVCHELLPVLKFNCISVVFVPGTDQASDMFRERLKSFTFLVLATCSFRVFCLLQEEELGEAGIADEPAATQEEPAATQKEPAAIQDVRRIFCLAKAEK